MKICIIDPVELFPNSITLNTAPVNPASRDHIHSLEGVFISNQYAAKI
jgi:hypothetical protein